MRGVGDQYSVGPKRGAVNEDEEVINESKNEHSEGG